jgi:type I restriction enzyme M protein
LDIATNNLSFEKGGPMKDVWFYAHPYPQGYKFYSHFKPLTICEFDLAKNWWGGLARKGRKTTERAWKVSAKDFARLKYHSDSKNSHEEEVMYADPEELMAEYQQIVKQLKVEQKVLKRELMDCLSTSKRGQTWLMN